MTISLVNGVYMVLIGLLAGAATGLSGASGVMIVVPLLTMVLQLPVKTAIGTSLMVDVIASLGISYTYFRHGNIDLASGVWVALGSVAGAQLGSLLAVGISEGGMSGAFGAFIGVAGIMMLTGRTSLPERLSKTEAAGLHLPNRALQSLVAAAIGLALGLVTGIMGAGGGVMILLVLLLVFHLPLHKAIGTSTLVMAITATSGALGYGLRGSISLWAGFLVGAGAVLGGVLAARFANRVSEEVLSRALGGIFVLLGLTMGLLQVIG